MELLHFSPEEEAHIRQTLTLINPQTLPLSCLPADTQIVKSADFFAECEQLAPYYNSFGLENGQARIVYTSARSSGHRILLNAATVQGSDCSHVLCIHLAHLVHLIQYGSEHSNLHRLNPEQALSIYYYEFLLWSSFQAMRISSQVQALLAWHKVHGPEPPADGCYSFGSITFHSGPLIAALERLKGNDSPGKRQELLWEVVEQLVSYLGSLASWQNQPEPGELDHNFPAIVLSQSIGISNVLALYTALLQIKDYSHWQEAKEAIRRAVHALRQQAQEG